jgi:hypothetical protein
MIRVASGRRQFINAFVIKWEFDQDVWGVALEFANGDQHNYRVGSYSKAVADVRRSSKQPEHALDVISPSQTGSL